MEQILAKTTVLDPLLQVLVGCGNHAHIGLDGAVSADAVEMAIAEHTQQAGLQLKRHVANLVQKQRTAICLLKSAPAHGLGPGKGTTLMAKEFAFQQVLRDGRGVDSHERPTRARRMFVQRARNQFLARTRFTGDHDCDITLAQASDRTKHVLHGWRLT